MKNNKISLREKLMPILVVLVYLGLLTLGIWIFFIKGQGSLKEKLEFPLQALTVYTLTFGFLSTSDILKDFTNLTEDMTSPNIFKFMRSNIFFLMLFILCFAVMIDPDKTIKSQEKKEKTSMKPLSLFMEMLGIFMEMLGIFMVLFTVLFTILIPIVGFLIMIVYIVFHIMVIMPISYIAYVIVSYPIREIQTSGHDMEMSCGTQDVSIKGIFSQENEVAMRNFLIAIPAVILQVVLPILLSIVSTLSAG
jgi:small-conductance mechanosensitive channel